ncbi:hypothetical protein ABID56_002415 [Alkalibacillus flavidus]|uniref:YqhG n=1 Tax=Alkalibacillus flavidus TaxID=546021 RepID=A0ABV2KXH1_9BACI
MKQADIQPFVSQFFNQHGAHITHEEDGFMTVQLTETLDKQLMNRPFYWQYVDTMGFEGEPMTVAFSFSDKHQDGQSELIHLGSPRLHQLFQIVQREGAFTTLFEHAESESDTKALDPWFVMNGFIQYQGAWIAEEQISIGILLTNGTMRFAWMDEMQDHHFKTIIPPYHYKIPTIISIESALQKMTSQLNDRITNQSQSFINQSITLYNREMNLLQTLSSEDTQSDQTFIKQSEQHIYDRLYPNISLQWINGGMFYTTQQTTKQLIHV